MRKQRNMFQTRKQNKILERVGETLNEMEISDLTNKEFKVMVINMLMELRRMDEYSGNLNKKIENIQK